MDNERTIITCRQANPSRPEQINSLSINDCCLFFPPFLCLSLFQLFSCVRLARGWVRADIQPRKELLRKYRSWSVDRNSNTCFICQCQAVTHSLTHIHTLHPSIDSLCFLLSDWQLTLVLQSFYVEYVHFQRLKRTTNNWTTDWQAVSWPGEPGSLIISRQTKQLKGIELILCLELACGTCPTETGSTQCEVQGDIKAEI